MIQKSYQTSNCLYIVPTPIGNMEDITLRAINILKSVDIILCEDTRDSSVLLNHFQIKKRLISCHEFNEDKMIDTVITYLKDGMSIAFITDQGTPIISDPGFVISRAIIDAGFSVVSLPGATAFVPALTSSGIEPSPFLFYGFLNSKKSKQISELVSLKDYPFTIIFYESVHRLKDTLNNMLDVFGDRKVSLNREISKIHEEVIRDNLSNVIAISDSLKGEFVIVVEGNKKNIDFSSIDIVDHVKLYLDDGISEKEAIKIVAKERHVAKSIIYKEYHDRK